MPWSSASFLSSIQKGRLQMKIQSQLSVLSEQNRYLPLLERAAISCRLAKEFEKSGEYESAREALSEFWPDEVGAPKLDGLDEAMKAEVLLRIGALAGFQGSADQTTGRQEVAKDLITKSIEIFEAIGQLEKAAEARGDLAVCYWREGGYDEARIHLANALNLVCNRDSDVKALLLIRAGIVEVWALRLNEALRFYNEAAPLVERSEDHALKGSFHTEFGLVFRRLATPDNRETYLDRALVEYAAASFHFERAGNTRYLARVENNLGFLYFTIGQYKDAHKHLDRARQLFLSLRDVGTVAQVDDTRARTLLAEGRIVDAERVIRASVKTLERGDHQALLAEALTTYGVVLARLGNYTRARALLDDAIRIAETAGDMEGAGKAQLSVIEELSNQTSARELVSIYERSVELLQRSQDPSANKRLISSALKVIDALSVAEAAEQEAESPSWEGFSFRKEVLKIEKALIGHALRDAGGSVTKAARLLGFRHHQSLIALINSRHKDLLTTRSAVRKRRRHLFSEPRKIKKKTPPEPEEIVAS